MSEARFADGLRYRIEIPSVEGPAVFRAVLEEDFPVFCSHVTPADSTWRWELEATQVAVTVRQVRIGPGDWVVGDDDGVVVVPQSLAESVLAEAEEKAATESEIRAAVRGGASPLEVYERYGTF